MASAMVASGTTVNCIDQLERAGINKRVRNPEEGVRLLVCLSKTVFNVINAVVGTHVATQAKLISGLPSKERILLDRFLKKFVTVLEG